MFSMKTKYPFHPLFGGGGDEPYVRTCAVVVILIYYKYQLNKIKIGIFIHFI